MDSHSQTDKDLHRKLAALDRKLPTADLPSYDSLVQFLCRRIVPSNAMDFIKRIIYVLIRCLLYLLGFEDAHNRIQNDHNKDPVNKCWYSPKMADDRFAIRPGDTFFDASTLPSQVQMSYALVLRGITHDVNTTILDGLGEDVNVDNNKANSKDKLYPDRLQIETCLPMLHRSSLLILSILKARDFYTGQEFKPDEYKGQPFTMQWYSFLFSTSVQFHRELIERYTAPREYSRHVIVMYGGRAYSVEMIRTDVMGEEVMPTYEEIKRQLERVIQMDGRSPPSLEVSAITSLSAKDRHVVEQNLVHASDRNNYNFAVIRDSLLVISLDPDDQPRTANDALFCLQSKNFTNRWYDRSVNLVVFGNGVAGFVMNYLAGMTGAVASSFAELVKNKEEEILVCLQEEYLASHDQIKLKELKAPSYLHWDDIEDKSICKTIKQIIKLKEESGPFAPLRQVAFRLNCDLTRKALIERSVSPCGTFHAALQLALLRVCGRHTSVFEIVSIRNFKFGGMTWMETNTTDMNLFLNAASAFLSNSKPDVTSSKEWLKILLRKAIASYRENVVLNKKGDVTLWHLDSIYRTLGLETRLPRQRNKLKNLRSLIQQPLIDFLREPSVNLLPPSKAETFTSNPGWNPAVEAVGRVGVKSMLPLGVHYLFGKTAISITVSSLTNHPCHGKEKQLAKELQNAFAFIKKLLDDD
ncbi:choline O-acetyltransferase-like [Actinia tenebrosa]|uniref:Choline O-acetyltransferase-like n=1 Tax=Actinia tenebrosa TaxID=6105 RepID=A0A6P8HM27_ACTTE|nr:choline O-acetyltransferase-like [Actinia tenebrosa]XP_031556781.1 choline O-acetyltransferase-like [Actinia tenebrosa]